MIGERILHCEISENNVNWNDDPPVCESKYILSLAYGVAVLKLFDVVSVSEWKVLSRVWPCNPMDYPGDGILQARILEWGAFSFSRGSSQPKVWTQVYRIAGRLFTSWTSREAPLMQGPLYSFKMK